MNAIPLILLTVANLILITLVIFLFNQTISYLKRLDDLRRRNDCLRSFCAQSVLPCLRASTEYKAGNPSYAMTVKVLVERLNN